MADSAESGAMPRMHIIRKAIKLMDFSRFVWLGQCIVGLFS